jgi:hypothetical protein
MMKTSIGILYSLVALALLGGVGIAAADEAAVPGSQAVTADSIAPYTGPIGPDNSLYGLKIAFENLDESFTFNQSEKLAKQINHTGTRLAELKKELAENRTDAAAIALDEYWHKINQTEETLEPLPPGTNQTRPEVTGTGLQNAEDQIAKHQQVLEDLMQSHPGNTGLARAYNNSVKLEEKFAEKIAEKSGKRQLQQDAGSATDFPRGMNQTVNLSGTGRDGLPGNGNNQREMNQTMNRSSIGPDGFSGMNQSMNKGGSGQDGLSGNQSMNRSGSGPGGQAANQSAQGQHQQSGSGAPANNGQNTDVNNGNSQNQNNANTGNTNTGNRNNNANTNTGTGNNKGNTGATNGGNTNANMRGNGR